MEKKIHVNFAITKEEIKRLEEIKKICKVKTNSGAVRKLIEYGKL